MPSFTQAFIWFFTLLTLTACGGSGGSNNPTTTGSGGQQSPTATMTMTRDDAAVDWIDAENPALITVTVSGVSLPATIKLSTSKGKLSTNEAGTDTEGVAKIIVSTAGEAVDLGDAIITVSVNDVNVGSLNFNIRSLSTGGGGETPDEELTIKMTNAEGNEVQTLLTNTEVLVTATLTNPTEERLIIEFATDLGTLDQPTALTNDQGVATVTLNAGTEVRAGKISINITDGGKVYTLPFEVVEDPNVKPPVAGPELSIAMKDAAGNDITQIHTGIQGVVSATLTEPRKGVLVEFTTSRGILSADSALTDDNGIAEVTITADNTRGAGTLSANIKDSVKKASLNFEIIPAPEPAPELTLTITTLESVETRKISEKFPGLVIATLTEPRENVIIEFATDKGNLSSQSSLTDSQGVAKVNINAAGDRGAGTITAKIRDNQRTYPITFEITDEDQPRIELALTKISDGTNTRTITTSSPALVTAQLFNGKTPSIIEFNTSNGRLSAASALTNDDGIATIELHATGEVAAGRLTANILDSEDVFHVDFATERELNTSQIVFEEAVPQRIVFDNMSGINKSSVRFKALDPNGEPVPEQAIAFSILGGPGDASLETTTGTTDADGRVAVILRAGNVATTVRVVAELIGSDPLISSPSTSISISTGIADQNSMSLSVDTPNIEGWKIDGVEANLTMRLADHFNNPIADGNMVEFVTEGGAVEPSCSTENGGCSVKFTSQERRPRVGSRVGLICFVPDNNMIPPTCPGGDNPEPYGGRITVLGFITGEESFADLNGSGFLDTESELQQFLRGDAVSLKPFDVGEAFVDFNDNGQFDLGDEQEEFVDRNRNETWDAPNGKYNGNLCRPGDIQALIDACPTEDHEKAIDARDSANIILSGSKAHFTVQGEGIGNTPKRIGIDAGKEKLISVTISDLHNNVLPAGTTVKVEAAKMEVAGSTSFIIGSSFERGGTSFSFSAKLNEEETTGSVTIIVETPKKFITAYQIGFDLINPPIPPEPEPELMLTVNPNRIFNGTPGTVSAQLTNVKKDVLIEFTTTRGNLSIDSALTNEAGIATTQLSVGDELGAGTVTAKIRTSERVYEAVFEFIEAP